MKLIFLDTETTGIDLKKDRLCQICYKIDDNLVVKNFKPEIPITIKAMSVTHITNKMVENDEVFKESKTYKDLKELLKDDILVAHNAKFDVAMLENEGLKVPRFICTLKLSRYLDDRSEIPEYNLQFLRYYFNIEISGIDAHSADGDVLVLEAVFEYLYNKAKEKTKDVSHDDIIKRMIRISLKPSIIRRFVFGKYKGSFVEDVAKEDPSYLRWLLGTKEDEGTDEDWIYTCRYYLGMLS